MTSPAWIFLIQASPVAGQVLSEGFEAGATVAFEASILDEPIVSREGYFQLSWVLSGAAEFDGTFRVTELVSGEADAEPETSAQERPPRASSRQDSQSKAPQRVVYEGSVPIAFVSGLPDGTYRYRVEAIDARGNVFARSAIPATVHVMHWPLWQTMTLLVIGAIVFLSVIVVIVRGTLMHRPNVPTGKTSNPIATHTSQPSVGQDSSSASSSSRGNRSSSNRPPSNRSSDNRSPSNDASEEPPAGSRS